MKFKDIKINQRFKFIGDPKIYLKEDNSTAIRNMMESYIFQDANVELAKEDEEEDYEEVESRSYYSYLVHEEGVRNPNEND